MSLLRRRQAPRPAPKPRDGTSPPPSSQSAPTPAPGPESSPEAFQGRSEVFPTGEPIPEPLVHVGPESTAIEVLVEKAAGYASKSRADSTRRKYEHQWKLFGQWCAGRGVRALPTSSPAVVLFLTERAEHVGLSSLAQFLAAVAHFHLRAKYPNPAAAPEVRTVWEGICRTKGLAPERRVKPLSPEILRAAFLADELSLRAVRDRSLLLLGFAAARRRVEVTDLEVPDVGRVPDGLEVRIRRSKTDQLGEGEIVGVPYGSDRVTCPVRALEDWLAMSGIVEGPLFQSIRGGRVTGKKLNDKEAARAVKSAVARVGLDPRDYSGHSMRSGFATTAAKNKKSMHDIARQTGHKSMTQLDRYIREAGLFEDNPARGIGL